MVFCLFAVVDLSSAAVAILGALAGVGSMLLYARLSPQAAVIEVSERASAARLALNQFDGSDVREVLSLARTAVGLSLRHLALILGPTLAAGAAALAAGWATDSVFSLSHFQPGWIGSHAAHGVGYALFWGPLTVAAATLKWKLQIK